MDQNMGQRNFEKICSNFLHQKAKKKSGNLTISGQIWLRRQDLNLRPPGYELRSRPKFHAIPCFLALFSPISSTTRVSFLHSVLSCPPTDFPVWVKTWVKLPQSSSEEFIKVPHSSIKQYRKATANKTKRSIRYHSSSIYGPFYHI